MLGRLIRRATLGLVLVASVAACGDDDSGGEGDAAERETATSSTLGASPSTSGAPEVPAATSADEDGTSSPEASTDATVPTTSDIPTAEELLAEATDDDIASVGGRECALALVTLVVAGQQFASDRGVEPGTIDELVAEGYLTEPQLWEIVDGTLQPNPGSGCINPEVAATCVDDATRLAVAQVAFLQAHPEAAQATQAELLDAGLIEELEPDVDLVDGVVVAVPGGTCDGNDVTIDWEQACTSDLKTMEVAMEAHYAQNGSYATSEGELVTAGMIRSESPLVDLAGEDVVAAPGGPCEGLDLS